MAKDCYLMLAAWGFRGGIFSPFWVEMFIIHPSQCRDKFQGTMLQHWKHGVWKCEKWKLPGFTDLWMHKKWIRLTWFDLGNQVWNFFISFEDIDFIVKQNRHNIYGYNDLQNQGQFYSWCWLFAWTHAWHWSSPTWATSTITHGLGILSKCSKPSGGQELFLDQTHPMFWGHVRFQRWWSFWPCCSIVVLSHLMVAGRNWNVYAFDGAYPYLIDIYIYGLQMFSFCFINLLYQESGAIYLIILMLLLSIYIWVPNNIWGCLIAGFHWYPHTLNFVLSKDESISKNMHSTYEARCPGTQDLLVPIPLWGGDAKTMFCLQQLQTHWEIKPRTAIGMVPQKKSLEGSWESKSFSRSLWWLQWPAEMEGHGWFTWQRARASFGKHRSYGNKSMRFFH